MTTILHDRKHGTFSLEGRRGVYNSHEVAAQERDADEQTREILALISDLAAGDFDADMCCVLMDYAGATPDDEALPVTVEATAPHLRWALRNELRALKRMQEGVYSDAE